MTDLSALIARLEAAEVGSRELDAAVYDQLFPRLTRDGKAVAGFPGRWPFHPGSAHDEEVLPVTTSLDAALALAERVLPGWLWDVTTITTAVGGLRKPLASVVRPDQPEGEEIKTWGYGSTPALALVIAILRAKQGEGE